MRHPDWRRWLLGASLCLLVALAGCDAHSARPGMEEGGSSKSERSVCPSCAIAGGETGDFNAEISACGKAYAKREIDRSEAEALGFPVAEAIGLVEQPIDTAMTWTAVETRNGGPARGYEPKTHVQVVLTVDSL